MTVIVVIETPTEKESEGAPDQLKYSRHFPYQNNHQKASYDFCRNHSSILVIFVEYTKGTIHHKSEESVHRTDVV